MRPLLLAIIAVACVWGGATDAMACRMRVPHADQLANRKLVIATMRHADRVDAPGWNTWRIVADTASDGPLSVNRSTVEFTTTLTSDGCGQTPLPPEGERWVLYLDQTDSNEVLDAFPLDYVREYDVRLTDVR